MSKEYTQESVRQLVKDFWEYEDVEKLRKELEASDFAQDNMHYIVYSDGNVYVQKPLSLGVRSRHCILGFAGNGLRGTSRVSYNYWEENEGVVVRTEHDALRLSAAVVYRNAMHAIESISISFRHL